MPNVKWIVHERKALITETTEKTGMAEANRVSEPGWFLPCLAAVLLAVSLMTSTAAAAADTESDGSTRFDTFNVVYFDTVPYVSLVDLGETYRVPLEFEPYTLSMTAKRGDSSLRITSDTSTALLNGTAKNIILPARMLRGSIYAPIPTVLPLFSSLVPGDLSWDERRRAIGVTGITTTIKHVSVESYANGTLLVFALSEPMKHTIEKRDNNWLTITFENGSFNRDELFSGFKSDIILDRRCFQHEHAAEISFQLSDEFGDYSASSSADNELLVSLRHRRSAKSPPYSNASTESFPVEPNNDLQLWRIDTVVIDPGHGGKDPGAVGPGKTREKDIVLDFAKELKNTADKHGEIKAVLTRDKDVFLPLHRRAQIARDVGGKLFISIHANASPNRRAKGFEVFFLSAAKTKDAEDVARRENKAIELEEDMEYYADFLNLTNLPKDIRDIQIEMEMSGYLKESQYLCRILLDKACDSTRIDSRGVKQAGFLVMSGTQAFMPSILVEIGFISNPEEEKMLKRSSYQKKLAEAVYEAIILFKKEIERGYFREGE